MGKKMKKTLKLKRLELNRMQNTNALQKVTHFNCGTQHLTLTGWWILELRKWRR